MNHVVDFSPETWGKMTTEERRMALAPPGFYDSFVEVKISDVWRDSRAGRDAPFVSIYFTAVISGTHRNEGYFVRWLSFRYHDGDDAEYAARDRDGAAVRDKEGNLKRSSTFQPSHCSDPDGDQSKNKWPENIDETRRKLFHLEQFLNPIRNLLNGRTLPPHIIDHKSPYAMQHSGDGAPCWLCGGEKHGERQKQEAAMAQRRADEAKKEAARAAEREESAKVAAREALQDLIKLAKK